MTLPSLPDLFAFAGVAVFAATGAIAAAHRKHDVVTFVFFAAITGLGGGTLRDLFLGAPVVWIADPTWLAVCVVTGAVVWVLGFGQASLRALLWLDAVGLAAFSVMGAAKALSLGTSPGVAVLMGVLTATAGGIIRDVTAGEPSVLLQREVYVTAALLAAAVYVLASPYVGKEIAGVAGFAAGLGLRAAALIFRWSLPAYFGGVFGRFRRA